MKSSSVLDEVVLGYGPVFDQRRQLSCLRLSVFPAGATLSSRDGEALWELLGQALAQAPQPRSELPRLWVSVASEVLLDGLLQAAQQAPNPVLVEVPAFLTAKRWPLLQSLALAGQAFALSGEVPADLKSSGPAVFKWQCRGAQDGQSGQALPGSSLLVVGARWDRDLDTAFEQGAVAVAGWPMDEELRLATPLAVPPELRGVLDLMNRVEREEPVARLEAVLTADPTLAYRLLRYLNASAFGLRAEITSFRHGLMMLGHRRLKRWLALLLVSGSQDPSSRMLMAVASRRGLIMDQLAAGLTDEAMRSEMFICGIFSLLDRMLRMPMDELIRSVPMPPRVQESLLARGPYSPHLDLMRAVEEGSAADIRACADAALLSCGELNRAILKGLTLSWELD